MKTNITINLFGQLYHIDEDAYQLLKNYEENMRRYFSNKTDGEEIIDDIEHRVAELFAELKSNGTLAINIEHVQEIIRRIGNPEQIVEDPETEYENTSEKGDFNPPPYSNSANNSKAYDRPQRRLMRDVKDSMLGGVSSGLSHYLGIGDPIFIRIAWIILLFLPYFPGFITYIILWLIMPPALTPEERLQMLGQRVSPENINEEIINSSATGAQATYSQPKSAIHRLMNPLFSICVFAFKAIVLGLLVIFILFVFFILMTLLGFTMSSPLFLQESSFIDPEVSLFINTLYAQGWQIWTLMTAATITLGMPIFALTRRILKNDNKPVNKTKRTFSVTLWIVALITTVALCISVAINTNLEIKEQKRLDNTRNGIYLKGRSWDILDNDNWSIEKIEHVQPRIYDYCTNLFSKNREVSYIHVRNALRSRPMVCTIQRFCDVEPGTYIIEAIAKTTGDGCYLFSQPLDTTKVQLTPVPSNIKKRNSIEKMTWETSQETPYFKNATDSIGWKRVQKNSADEEWYYVASEPFHHDGGKLRYGITNDQTITQYSWFGKDFSFYDIVLTKIPNK